MNDHPLLESISNLNIITEKNHLEIKSILDIEDYIGENNNYNKFIN